MAKFTLDYTGEQINEALGLVLNEELLENKDGVVKNNNVANKAITRAKLANDALYSPIRHISITDNILETDLGKTLVDAYANRATISEISINEAVMKTYPIGFEVAILRAFSTVGLKVNLSGMRVLIAGEGVLDNSVDRVLSISELGGMIAIKKIDNGSTAGSLILITGNVEVMS